MLFCSGPVRFKDFTTSSRGRWYRDTPPLYVNGLVRYIHNIDVHNFSLARLLHYVHHINELDHQPDYFWYCAYGCPLGSGMRALQSNEDLLSMWQNADDNGMPIATVYMQDRLLQRSPDRARVIYRIPMSLPGFDPSFEALSFHVSALSYFEHDQAIGRRAIRRERKYGLRPYLSLLPTPRPIPVRRNPPTTQGFMIYPRH